jgi:membrane protease YdiL (CAAX protease family)
MTSQQLHAALEEPAENCYQLDLGLGVRLRALDPKLVGPHVLALRPQLPEAPLEEGIWGIRQYRFLPPEAVRAIESLPAAQCARLATVRRGKAVRAAASDSLPWLRPPYGVMGLAALAGILFLSYLPVAVLRAHLHRFTPWSAALAITVPLMLLQAGVAGWSLARRGIYRRLSDWRWRPGIAALAFVAGMGFTAIFLWAEHLRYGAGVLNPSPSATSGGAGFVLLTLAAMVSAELLQRGIILPSLLAYLPPWPALLLGAMAAALLQGQFWAALPLQFAACIVYRKFGHNWPASLAFRLANNLLYLALVLKFIK